ncbi:MAG: hypothetical protein ACREJC_18965 [Tepidisphaeraceae bacterium]
MSKKHTSTIRYSVAPVSGIIERHTSMREAEQAARRHGAHIHQEEAESRRGWVYMVCDCDGVQP